MSLSGQENLQGGAPMVSPDSSTATSDDDKKMPALCKKDIDNWIEVKRKKKDDANDDLDIDQVEELAKEICHLEELVLRMKEAGKKNKFELARKLKKDLLDLMAADPASAAQDLDDSVTSKDWSLVSEALSEIGMMSASESLVATHLGQQPESNLRQFSQQEPALLPVPQAPLQAPAQASSISTADGESLAVTYEFDEAAGRETSPKYISAQHPWQRSVSASSSDQDESASENAPMDYAPRGTPLASSHKDEAKSASAKDVAVAAPALDSVYEAFMAIMASAEDSAPLQDSPLPLTPIEFFAPDGEQYVYDGSPSTAAALHGPFCATDHPRREMLLESANASVKHAVTDRTPHPQEARLASCENDDSAAAAQQRSQQEEARLSQLAGNANEPFPRPPTQGQLQAPVQAVEAGSVHSEGGGSRATGTFEWEVAVGKKTSPKFKLAVTLKYDPKRNTAAPLNRITKLCKDNRKKILEMIKLRPNCTLDDVAKYLKALYLVEYLEDLEGDLTFWVDKARVDHPKKPENRVWRDSSKPKGILGRIVEPKCKSRPKERIVIFVPASIDCIIHDLKKNARKKNPRRCSARCDEGSADEDDDDDDDPGDPNLKKRKNERKSGQKCKGCRYADERQNSQSASDRSSNLSSDAEADEEMYSDDDDDRTSSESNISDATDTSSDSESDSSYSSESDSDDDDDGMDGPTPSVTSPNVLSEGTIATNPDLDILGVSVYHLEHVFLEEVSKITDDDGNLFSRSSKIFEIEDLQGPSSVIRRKGASVVCPVDGKKGAAYVHCLQGDDYVGYATHILSYSWAYSIGDIVDTLSEYCHTHGFNPKRTYVWICCLCVNQHRVVEQCALQKSGMLTPAEQVDFFSTFGERAKRIGRVLPMMAPWKAPIYLTRVWCVFELFIAHTNGCMIDIVMPPQEKASMVQDIITEGGGIDALYEVLRNTKVQSTKASMESDRREILQQVEATVGFQVLNNQVNGLLRAWMQQVLVELVEEKKNTNDMNYAEFCTKVGEILSANGQHTAASKIHRTALSIREAELGDHPDTASTRVIIEQVQGEYDGCTSTFVPNFDVCKLSYYLRCGTEYCNVKVINDPKILEYKTAHCRKHERQNEIFRLASSDYSIDTLINKTIFLVSDGNPMLEGSSNKFYDAEKVSSLVAVDSPTVIAGKQTQVAKIMVCNMEWLKKHYFDPIARNRDKIRKITGAQLADMDMLAALLLSSLVIQDEGEKSNHCQHCKGLAGMCTCEEGCPTREHSECLVVHQGVTCDGCLEPHIHGARYKCKDCFNYDLCSDCYHIKKAHDKTHTFFKIPRVGSSMEVLPPRQPAAVLSPKVEVSPINVDEFYEGQGVTLINMTDACRNGLRAKVVKSIGKRIIVDLVGRNEQITVPPENLKAIVCLIAPETIVELCNLKAQANRNGALAMVVSNANVSPNCVAVKLLDDESVVLSVKPENCRIIEDAV